MNSIYNGIFTGNILVAGRASCGKKIFLEKLAINKFFGETVKSEWVSSIDIDKKHEEEIQSCFSNETEIHIAKEVDELDSLIENFKLRADNDSISNNLNSFRENKTLNRLIVLDDVSGIADSSKKFANFLTILRKIRYSCVYVFHLIIPSSQIWEKPASVPINSVSKILQVNCVTQSKKYVPVRYVWLNRVFTDLANSHEKHCLTIDCSYLNENGPGRYRSQANNPEKQVCYFNKPNDDEFYNIFISERIKGDNYDKKIYFKIKKVRGKTDSENFDAKKTLESGTSNVRFRELLTTTNSDTKQTVTGTKSHGDVNKNLYRKSRNSARPKFLQ